MPIPSGEPTTPPPPTTGQLLDSLGVTLDLGDGDIVPDAIVVAKVVEADGSVKVAIGSSEATTWLDELGLVTAASDIVRQPYMQTGGGTTT